MLQLANETPLRVVMTLVPDRRGVESLLLLARGTFTLEEAPRLCPVQGPLQVGDEWTGEPGLSALHRSNEFHPPKPAVDVLLLGAAHCPEARPRPFLDLALQVGAVERRLRVFGDRRFTGQTSGAIATDPEPFASMPLTWERAFGGRSHDGTLFEPGNPVGVGLLPADLRRAPPFRGLPLPNVEDPAALLQSPGQRVAPTGVGPIAPTWSPRSSFAGTYDDAWDRSRAPFLPDDFDDRHHLCAPAAQVSDRPLLGGEPIRLDGFSPAGAIVSRVPRASPTAYAVVGRTTVPLSLTLDTLLLEPDDATMSLVWRAMHPVDKRALDVRSVHVAWRAGAEAP